MRRPDHIKDLGVIFDPKLTFSKHVETTVSSAFKCLNFIIRNSKGFSNKFTLRLLYVSFVRSKLEYASIVWTPIYVTHIGTFERIQRQFLKFAVFLLDGVYPTRGFPHELLLARFDLTELSKRRSTQLIIFLYKIVNNILDCPGILRQIYIRVPRISARHNNIFNLPTANTNILRASPLYLFFFSICSL